MCLDQRSVLEFATDNHVAADSDALACRDRINRMQFLAKAQVPRTNLPRREINFNQGDKWKAAINTYIGTIPPKGDAL